MESFRKVLENVGLISEKLKPVFVWGSLSRGRQALILYCTFTFAVVAILSALSYLQHVNSTDLQVRLAEFQRLEAEEMYVSANAAIATCNDAMEKKLVSANQYCAEASRQYGDAFRSVQSPIAQKNIQMHLYPAMQDHIGRVQRADRRIKVLRQPDSPTAWILKHSLTLWGGLLISAVTLGAVGFAWRETQRNQQTPFPVLPRN